MITGSFRRHFFLGPAAGPNSYLEIIVDTVQLVSCTDIFTLKAAVITGDPAKHSYYWQQVSGTPVIFLEPQNQLMVMVQKAPSTTGDLHFRFWVDKGTPFEQYKDTFVSTNALEFVTYATNVSNKSEITQSPTAITGGGLGVTLVYLIPGVSFPGTSTIDNTNLNMIWTNPTVTYPVVNTKTILYNNVSGTLNWLAEYATPGNSYPYNSGIGQPNRSSTYVLRSIYNLYNANQFTSYVDVTASFTNNRYVDTSENVNGFATNISNSSVIKIFQLQILSLVGVGGDETVDKYPVNIAPESKIAIFQTQILTLLPLPVNNEDISKYDINISSPSRIKLFQIQTSDGIINV